MSERSFVETFQQKLDSIYQRAESAGMTITGLCKSAGISRATPDRWRRRPPHTITLIDRFEEEVRKVEEANAAASSQQQ